MNVNLQDKNIFYKIYKGYANLGKNNNNINVFIKTIGPHFKAFGHRRKLHANYIKKTVLDFFDLTTYPIIFWK